MTEVVIVEEWKKTDFKNKVETKIGNGYALVACGSDNVRPIKTEMCETAITEYNADIRWWAIMRKD